MRTVAGLSALIEMRNSRQSDLPEEHLRSDLLIRKSGNFIGLRGNWGIYISRPDTECETCNAALIWKCGYFLRTSLSSIFIIAETFVEQAGYLWADPRCFSEDHIIWVTSTPWCCLGNRTMKISNIGSVKNKVTLDNTVFTMGISQCQTSLKLVVLHSM